MTEDHQLTSCIFRHHRETIIQSIIVMVVCMKLAASEEGLCQPSWKSVFDNSNPELNDTSAMLKSIKAGLPIIVHVEENGEWVRRETSHISIQNSHAVCHSLSYLSDCPSIIDNLGENTTCRTWLSISTNATAVYTTYNLDSDVTVVFMSRIRSRWYIQQSGHTEKVVINQLSLRKQDSQHTLANNNPIISVLATAHEQITSFAEESDFYSFQLINTATDRQALKNQAEFKMRQITYPKWLYSDELPVIHFQLFVHYCPVPLKEPTKNTADLIDSDEETASLGQLRTFTATYTTLEIPSAQAFNLDLDSIRIENDGSVTASRIHASMLGVWSKYADHTKWTCMTLAESMLTTTDHLALGGWHYSKSEHKSVKITWHYYEQPWRMIFENEVTTSTKNNNTLNLTSLKNVISSGKPIRLVVHIDGMQYAFLPSELRITSSGHCRAVARTCLDVTAPDDHGQDISNSMFLIRFGTDIQTSISAWDIGKHRLVYKRTVHDSVKWYTVA